MSFIDRILRKPKKTSASIAKERLSIIVSHERAKLHGTDYLPKLQKELIDVISKYVEIDKDSVHVALDRSGERSVLELNVSIPTSSADSPVKDTEEEIA